MPHSIPCPRLRSLRTAIGILLTRCLFALIENLEPSPSSWPCELRLPSQIRIVLSFPGLASSVCSIYPILKSVERVSLVVDRCVVIDPFGRVRRCRIARRPA